MLSWRDRHYSMAKERREFGEDKREFEEALKRDWEEFDPQKTMSAPCEPQLAPLPGGAAMQSVVRVSYDSVRGARG